jgi:2-polyprenyl-3-methyl-5-hydroxy-6-metoxy-1,4-benzoquinol methylase
VTPRRWHPQDEKSATIGWQGKKVVSPPKAAQSSSFPRECRCPICDLPVAGPEFFYRYSPLWFCRFCALYFALRPTFCVGEGIGKPLGQGESGIGKLLGQCRSLYDQLYVQSPEYMSVLARARDPARLHRLAFCERIFFRAFPHPLGTGRLLDVGCGSGRFLQLALHRGWKAQGVEISLPAVQVALSLGLPVFHGTLEDFLEKNAAPDCDAVVAFEVLEHVVDPLGFLTMLGKAASPGGVVAISVPNARDPFIFLDPRPEAQPPVHLQFFTRKALRTALARVGLKPVTIRTNFLPWATMRKVIPSKILRATLKIPLALFRILGLVEGHQIVALARRW